MAPEVRVSYPPGAVAAAEPGTPEHEELLRYVERLALAFASTGWPRMASRVFAYALAHNADRYTAAELSRGLRVSPAAISGAVRYLVSNGLLAKEREPGARVDTYRLYHDLWYEIALQRGDYIEPFIKIAEEGAELLGRETPGGRRMAETAEFYAFIRRRLPDLLTEWREYKRATFPG
jgi:DNA-binding transcriptional regulator GbsR (MarR family)